MSLAWVGLSGGCKVCGWPMYGQEEPRRKEEETHKGKERIRIRKKTRRRDLSLD